MITTWTLLIFLVYNPGNDIPPLFESQRVEFFTEQQCEAAAKKSEVKLSTRFRHIGTVCLSREPFEAGKSAAK